MAATNDPSAAAGILSVTVWISLATMLGRVMLSAVEDSPHVVSRVVPFVGAFGFLKSNSLSLLLGISNLLKP